MIILTWPRARRPFGRDNLICRSAAWSASCPRRETRQAPRLPVIGVLRNRVRSRSSVRNRPIPARTVWPRRTTSPDRRVRRCFPGRVRGTSCSRQSLFFLTSLVEAGPTIGIERGVVRRQVNRLRVGRDGSLGFPCERSMSPRMFQASAFSGSASSHTFRDLSASSYRPSCASTTARFLWRADCRGRARAPSHNRPGLCRSRPWPGRRRRASCGTEFSGCSLIARL